MSQLSINSANNPDRPKRVSESKKAVQKQAQQVRGSGMADAFVSSGSNSSAQRNLKSNSPSYTSSDAIDESSESYSAPVQGYSFNTAGLTPNQIALAVRYGAKAKMSGYRDYMDRSKFAAEDEMNSEVLNNDAEMQGIADAEGNQLTEQLLTLMQDGSIQSSEEFEARAKELINQSKEKIESKVTKAKVEKLKSQSQKVMNLNVKKLSQFVGKELTDEDREKVDELSREILVEDQYE